MTAQIESGFLSFYFRYSWTCGGHPKGKRPPGARRITDCFIKYQHDVDDVGRIVGHARVVQHQDDPDCKRLARRLALTRALKCAGAPKHHRKKVWETYFKATGEEAVRESQPILPGRHPCTFSFELVADRKAIEATDFARIIRELTGWPVTSTQIARLG